METNGTSYDTATPQEVIRILESVRGHNDQVILRYGDTETGRDWMAENYVKGRVGRSTGPVKVPLLVPPRAFGGPPILCRCIVKIIHAKTGKVMYQHPKYNRPEVSLRDDISMPEYKSSGYFDDKLVARFKTQREANKWHKFMTA
jgi:hypothetical protein